MSEIYKAPEAELHDNVEVSDYGSLESGLAGNYQLEPTKIVKEAWKLAKGFKGVYWLALIIYMVIGAIVGAISGIFITPIEQQLLEPETITPLQIVGQVAFQVLSTFVTLPLTAGLFMISLKHSVGSPVRAEQVVKYYDKIVPLFLTTLLMYLLIFVGLLLLVLPGIYLMVAFSLAIPLVVEKDMSPWEALQTSRKAITHRWFSFTGLLLLLFLVMIAGVLALFIGLVWALPVVGLAYAIVYRNIFGVEAKTLAES